MGFRLSLPSHSALRQPAGELPGNSMKQYLPLNLSELLGIVGTVSLIFTFAKEFGTQVSTATAISLIAALVVAFTVAISRLWQREGDRFRLILTSDGT